MVFFGNTLSVIDYSELKLISLDDPGSTKPESGGLIWQIRRGEIKLPRFQRFEAWDRQCICSLMEMVIRNLPLGITLVLEVGMRNSSSLTT